MRQSVLPLKKVKREAAAQRRPARILWKSALFRKTAGRMVKNATRSNKKVSNAEIRDTAFPALSVPVL